MTNDGDFANRLTHPRFEVPKTYVATVTGEVTRQDVRRLVRGVYLAEGRTRTAEVKLLKSDRRRSLVEITIREGRNRQVRRMLARLGHGVHELVRTRIGRVTLRGMGVGQARPLSPEEVADLLKLSETPPAERRPAPRRHGARRHTGGPPGVHLPMPPEGAPSEPPASPKPPWRNPRRQSGPRREPGGKGQLGNNRARRVPVPAAAEGDIAASGAVGRGTHRARVAARGRACASAGRPTAGR